MAAKNVYGAKFNTPVGRFSYPHVFERSQGRNGKEGKFEVTLLVPKTTDLTDLKTRMEAVGKEAFGPKFKSLDALKNPPIKDGDAIADDKKLEGKDAEYCRGHWVLRAKTGTPISAVDATGTPIRDKDQIYGGCFGRLHVTPASYNVDGNWGVTLYLDAVQKWKDGERFGGGGVSAEEVFEALAVEEPVSLTENF